MTIATRFAFSVFLFIFGHAWYSGAEKRQRLRPDFQPPDLHVEAWGALAALIVALYLSFAFWQFLNALFALIDVLRHHS